MKTKYDWWAAFIYIADKTAIGFFASFFLFLILVLGSIIGITLLLQTLGWMAFIIACSIVAVVILVIMTYREIRKRGKLYAKY